MSNLWSKLAFWLRGSTPNPEALRDAEDVIRLGLAAGFQSHEVLVEHAAEMLSESHDRADFKGVASAALARMLEERKHQMRSWPAVTDCDRLDAAFEDLNAMGIMARHNWWCCSNCGSGAMPDEFERLEGVWQGVPIIGYIYYHEQDTERAAEGGGVYFGIGSMIDCDSDEKYEAHSMAIAKMAVGVIESHGLKVEWEGVFAKRPCVVVNWQRRARPARFCGGDGLREAHV